MSLIRIKTFQPFACYRKPFSYGFWDTFPLPPFSTILGWVHWVLGESENKEKIPMNIGIVGNFDSITYDLQTLIKFDRKRNKEGELVLDDFNKVLSNTPTYVANITNIFLRIYIQINIEHREKFLEKVLQVNYPSLGRYEDLMRIDAIDIITPKKISVEDFAFPINYGVFLKPETAQKGGCNGSNFLVPFYHKLNNDMRFFEKEKVVYLDTGSLVPLMDDLKILIDEDTDENFDKPIIVELFGKYSEKENEVLC